MGLDIASKKAEVYLHCLPKVYQKLLQIPCDTRDLEELFLFCFKAVYQKSTNITFSFIFFLIFANLAVINHYFLVVRVVMLCEIG